MLDYSRPTEYTYKAEELFDIHKSLISMRVTLRITLFLYGQSSWAVLGIFSTAHAHELLLPSFRSNFWHRQ